MRLRWLAAALLAGIFAAATAAQFFVRTPYADFSAPVWVDIERGSTTWDIARELTALGVLRSEYAFYLVRAVRSGATLQAGEYVFENPASAWEVYDRIARGDIYYYELRVPEGSNIFDVARIVGETGLVSSEEFLTVARDPAPILDLAPTAVSLEGYLFPSTYFISRHTSAADIARLMTDQFRKVWMEVGDRADVHETVTLASLVEKETAVPSERSLIAAVFQNRLDRGMKLECDPTVIYAAMLEENYRGVIHRSDLDRQHAYNTYQNVGLPPGPIANPGREALQATLEPADADFLFFVARPDGSGEHVFSTTLAAHNRAVRDYRQRSAENLSQEQAP